MSGEVSLNYLGNKLAEVGNGIAKPAAPLVIVGQDIAKAATKAATDTYHVYDVLRDPESRQVFFKLIKDPEFRESFFKHINRNNY